MKVESAYDIITKHINHLKREHSELNEYENYKLLTLLGLKYFVKNDLKFDFDEALESIVDGPNDAGIDAISNDSQTDTNDIVFIQSKYFDKTKLTKDALAKDILKITRGIDYLSKRKTEGLSQRLINAYHVAKAAEVQESSPHILYFTTYSPSPKEAENLRRYISDCFSNYDIQIYFGKEIVTQIECTENVKSCIEHGKIEIDKANNFLKYEEDAIIANVSARSLYNLYHLHQNGLFGMNLRYHIDNKKVDENIQDTIKHSPETFWFKNNGITIVCDDFVVDEKEITFTNFSIINGGQTTYKIANSNITTDFYLLCKIIRIQGDSEEERVEFATGIAHASNYQKPIKESDLKTNTPEQLRLREHLDKYNIYYITKRGDKLSPRQKKKYVHPYQITSMDEVGKVALAAILQLPGTARSTRTEMYNNRAFYDAIYNNPNVGIIADALRIQHYYNEFKKVIKKDKEASPKFKSITNCGLHWQIACICLLCMLQREFISKEIFISHLGKEIILKELFSKNKVGDKRLLNNSLTPEEEQSAFFELFDYIAYEILSSKYTDESEKRAQENKPELPVANFYKLDSVYYKSVIETVWKKYSSSKETRTGQSQPSELKKLIEKICS